MITYRIAEHFPDCKHAWGATIGQQHLEPLRRLLGQGPGLDDPGVVVVYDLTGVESTTASYLKASYLWLLRSAPLAVTGREGSPDADPWALEPLNIYPIVAGLQPDVIEEFNELLPRYGLPCLEAINWDQVQVRSARLRGPLDRTLSSTLEMLVREGRATATALHAQNPTETINVTGWNNRLADLYRFRLARRTKEGRQWVYEPVVPEVTVNG